MMIPFLSMKLRSLFLWPAVLTLAAAGTGCMVESAPPSPSNCVEDEWGDLVCFVPAPAPVKSGDAPTTTPRTVGIQADQTLESNVGEGVGLFVEYAAGGRWHLHTTCDTTSSSVGCAWEVFATPATGAALGGVQGENLEQSDSVDRQGAAIHFAAYTSTGKQGATFEGTPGAALELEVYLDGVLEPRYVYWVDAGVLHAGAPTDPVRFQPSTP